MELVVKSKQYIGIVLLGLLIVVTTVGIFFGYKQFCVGRRTDTHHRGWYEQQFQVGSTHLGRQEYEKAAEIFAHMITVDDTRAGVHFNQGRAYAGLGKYREALDCYHKAAECADGGAVKKYSYFYTGQILITLNHPDKALVFFDAAVHEDPAYYDAYLQRSFVHRSLKQYEQAYDDLKKIPSTTPHLALYYGILGQEARNSGCYDDAYKAFTQTVILEKNAHYLCALAGVRHILAKKEVTAERILAGMHEALALYNQASQLDNDSYHAHHNAALLLSELGRGAESSMHFEHALRIKPHSLETRMCIGMNQLKQGDYAQGWHNYEARFIGALSEELNSVMAPACASSVPRWRGEDIRGKKIFMYAEQAFGDTLQFIRCARTLKERGAYTIVSVQKPLFKLMSYCPYIDRLVVQGACEPIDADYRVPFMSVPGFLSATTQELFDQRPYLTAPREVVTRWQHYLAQHRQTCAAAVHVAIAWQGEISHDAGCYLGTTIDIPFKQIPRSVPAHTFFEVVSVPDVCFISVQKGVCMDDLHKTVPNTRMVHQLPRDFDTTAGSFVDTAAIMTLVDGVISVDTSVAHLAGGLGVPTWILLPAVAEWRWREDGATTAWYPHARLFRQPAIGDWDSVVSAIKKELSVLVANKKAAK